MTWEAFLKSPDLWLMVGCLALAVAFMRRRPSLLSGAILAIYCYSFFATNGWELIAPPPEVLRPARFESLEQAVAYIEAFEKNVDYMKEVFLFWGIGWNSISVIYALVMLFLIIKHGELPDKLLASIVVIAEIYTLIFQSIGCNLKEGMGGAELARIIGSAAPASVCAREFSWQAEATPTALQLAAMLGLYLIWKRKSPKPFGT